MPEQAPAPHLPARAALGPTGLHVALADIAPGELRDPFVQDTLRRVPAAQSLLHVPIPELGRASAPSAPAGLIFHVARCGSTLLSQLLKMQSGLVVYSEPLAINEVLVPPHQAPRAQMVAALRSLGALFARHARGPYVIKLSSWNLLFCDIIAEAFPGTPWALCMRDPLEVCVSLQSQPPGWLQGAGAAAFSPLFDPGNEASNPEIRLAQVFAAFCSAAVRLDPARGVLVPYETLPDAAWASVLPHFGLGVDEASKQGMVAASRIHSKSPVGNANAFARDVERKRGAASPQLRAAIDELARPALGPLLERLTNSAR